MSGSGVLYNCDNCGVEFELSKSQLKCSTRKHFCSLECRGKSQRKDLLGKQFKRLTVIEYLGQKDGRSVWNCECVCGKIFPVTGDSLLSGNTSSCGCSRLGTTNGVKHGLHGTRIYGIWVGMRTRCNCTTCGAAYNKYGGRGIKICDEWDDCLNFYNWAMSNGYQDNLSLDRIDNSGNYEPSNCRWATNKEQVNNRTNTRVATYGGVTKTASQWAEELGITNRTFRSRLDSNLSEEELFAKKRVSLNSSSHRGDRLDGIWRGIKYRCLLPYDRRYRDYGGRGIKICDEWLDKDVFREWAFNNGYKEDLSIDRIDVNGDYCPSNCRWATKAEQDKNKRNTKRLTYKGETLTFSDWAKKLGIGYSTLQSRIASRLPEEEIFYTGYLPHRRHVARLKRERENSIG